MENIYILEPHWPQMGALTISLIFSYWARSSFVLFIHCSLSSGRTSRYSYRHAMHISVHATVHLWEITNMQKNQPFQNYARGCYIHWGKSLYATTTSLFCDREFPKAPLIKLDRTAWSNWQLPSSTHSESGCSSAAHWCLPAGSWPGNYCWETSRPILSCIGEGVVEAKHEGIYQLQLNLGNLCHQAVNKQDKKLREVGHEFTIPPWRDINGITHLYERKVEWDSEVLLSRDPPTENRHSHKGEM